MSQGGGCSCKTSHTLFVSLFLVHSASLWSVLHLLCSVFKYLLAKSCNIFPSLPWSIQLGFPVIQHQYCWLILLLQNNWFDLSEAAIANSNSIVMTDKATVICKAQHSLLNKVIEHLLVTRAIVIKTALTIIEIKAKHFVFLASFSSLVFCL